MLACFLFRRKRTLLTADSFWSCAADLAEHYFVLEGSEDDEAELDWRNLLVEVLQGAKLRRR